VDSAPVSFYLYPSLRLDVKSYYMGPSCFWRRRAFLAIAAQRAKVLPSGGDTAVGDGLPFQAGKFLIIAGIVFVVLGALLLAPCGLIAGLRLPRRRDVAKNQEVAFLSSERALGLHLL
jgi:hypothetical protein